MAEVPEVQDVQQERYITQYFRGISDHERIPEGSWQDAYNITTDEYPVAQQRKSRTRVFTYLNDTPEQPVLPGLPVTGCVIGDKIYIGTEIGAVMGAGHIAWLGGSLKHIVATGRQIYTDNGYLLDEDLNILRQTAFTAQWTDAALTLCNDEAEEILWRTEKPEPPETGTLWYDHAAAKLLEYDGSAWQEIAYDEIYTDIPESPQAGAKYWNKREKKLYEYVNGAWAAQTDPADGDYRYAPDDLMIYRFVGANKTWSVTTATHEEPRNPINGEYLFDTKNNGLYKYSEAQGIWVPQTESYIRVEVTDGVDVSALRPGDAVRMVAGGENQSYLIHTVDPENRFITVRGLLNVTPTDDMIAAGEPLRSGVRIKKRLPRIDFMCEHNNRIFGCRFGENDDGKFVNEVYASALGDPTNWFKYEGTAGDSWTASVGAPGPWTGCAEVGEYVAFFKEDRIFLLSGTAPSSFRLMEYDDHGVQKGSEKSLVALKGTLIYKSNYGVMRLTPYSYPACISTDLGDDRWKDAAAGTDGRRYYITMEDDDSRTMYVYDTLTGYWTRETPPEDPMVLLQHADRLLAIGATETDSKDWVQYDEEAAAAAKPKRQDYPDAIAYTAEYLAWSGKCIESRVFSGLTVSDVMRKEGLQIRDAAIALIDGKIEDGLFLRWRGFAGQTLIYLRGTPDPAALEGNLYTVSGEETWTPLDIVYKKEDAFQWSLQTGWLGLSIPDEKRVRVIQIRVKTEPDTRFRVHIRYAGQNVWNEIWNVNRGQAGTYRIAHTPARRNDAYKLLIEGIGPMTLYSITTQAEDGGDRNVC